MVLCGCEAHRNFFDFISDPILPPVASPASGTFSYTLTAFLDKGDDSDSRIYFTFDPDAPYTDLSKWTDYYASGANGFEVTTTTKLRVFAYASPTRYSDVATIAWELKCPKTSFTPSPGTVGDVTVIYIVPPADTAFTVYYHVTSNGTDPDDGTFPSVGSGGGSFNIGIVLVSQPIRVCAVTQRTGWSDSDVVHADFYAGLPAASSFGYIPAAKVGEVPK